MALTKVPSELSSTPGIVDNSNATAITIDGSESVLVNRTAAFTTAKMEIQSDAGDASTLALNTIDTSGSVLEVYAAGTAVGSIGTTAGDLNIFSNTASHVGLRFGNTRLQPTDNAGATSDGVSDLGFSNSRFKDLYLSGDIAHKDAADNARLLYDKSSNLLGNAGTNLYGAGIYLGGTAAANYLDEYEEGTWTPTLAGHYGTLGTTFTQGTRNGVYTKIGNLVALAFEFTNAGVAAANNSDIVTVTGLPFSISGYGIVGSHAASSVDSHGGGSWTSITGTTLGNLGNNGTKSDNWSWLTGANFATTFSMRVTVIYRTTQ